MVGRKLQVEGCKLQVLKTAAVERWSVEREM